MIKYARISFVFGLTLFLEGLIAPAPSALAQVRSNILEGLDPRGKPELIVCSQNLMMFGKIDEVRSRSPGTSGEELKARGNDLARRVAIAQCDVVAVQEIVGRTEEGAVEGLRDFAHYVRNATGRIFDVRIGQTNDETLRVGFLVATDRASIQNVVSYARVELPKLTPEQKPRFFTRGPLEVQLAVRGRDDASSKTVSLVNMHFKSRAGAGDPTALEWETYRMEMAEALRKVVQKRHRAAFQTAQSLLVVLGDRNSNFDTATAKILDGTLLLSDFQASAPCRLSKRGTPLCQAGTTKPQELFSVLVPDASAASGAGTFLKGKEATWIDDILLPSESLAAAWRDYSVEGVYDSGMVSEPTEASDHALVYVRLNW